MLRKSFHTRKQNWATGWLPTASLMPVEPMSSPKTADWIGSWSHPGGTISISRGEGGMLSIEGEQTYLRQVAPIVACSARLSRRRKA